MELMSLENFATRDSRESFSYAPQTMMQSQQQVTVMQVQQRISANQSAWLTWHIPWLHSILSGRAMLGDTKLHYQE